MTATDAHITGEIKATSGVIGNNASNKITIGSNTTYASIYSGSHSALTSTVDGFYIGADGLSIGSNFSVTNAGKLTASDITINSGSIASTVTIGGKNQSEYLNSNIEIGGRNLLINSGDLTKWNKESGLTVVWDSTVNMFKITDPSHSSSRWGIYQDFSCEPNTEYTCSVVGMKVTENTALGLQSFKDTAGWPANKVEFTTTKTRMSYTLTTGADHNIIRVYLNHSPTATNQYYYMYQPKLEKGNKATDWTPAPEDIDVNKYVTEISNAGIWVTPSGKKPNSNGEPIVNATTGTTGTKIDNEGVGIYNAGVNVAQYGSSARVGAETSGHVNIASTGMDIYGSNGTVTLAHFGYEPTNGAPTDQGTQVSNDPYYTVGRRYDFTSTPNYSSTKAYSIGDIVIYENDYYVCIKDMDAAESWTRSHWLELFSTKIGSYSVAEGFDNIATAHGDHAEGRRTVAQGAYSHAEGYYTIAGSESASVALGAHSEGIWTMALSSATHAEGMNTIASGLGSHAEGEETEATGIHAHAQNNGTIARYSQTAIGEYNVAQGTNYGRSSEDFAFIIGNGVSNSARSNAFTVDWSGVVDAKSGYKVNSNTPIALETVTVDNITINGNSLYTWDKTGLSKTGYTLAGVIGFGISNATTSGTNSSLCTVYYCRKNSASSIQMLIRNTGSASSSSANSYGNAKVKLTADLLWVATGMI